MSNSVGPRLPANNRPPQDSSDKPSKKKLSPKTKKISGVSLKKLQKSPGEKAKTTISKPLSIKARKAAQTKDKVTDFFIEHQTPNLNVNTTSMKQVCRLMNELHKELTSKKHPPKTVKEIESKYVQILLKLERANNRSWRFVIDIIPDNKTGFKNVYFQISSPSPHFHRLTMEFDNKNKAMKLKFNKSSVDKSPDLSKIVNSDGVTLKTYVNRWNKAALPRVAILGGARVFAKESDKSSWGSKHSRFIQKNLNKALDCLEDTSQVCALINGGWQGLQEGSVGVPLQAHVFALSADEEPRGKTLGASISSLTIMPKEGEFDSHTIAEEQPMGNNLKFLVDGMWGDDSKYLIGASTGALLFDEYGFWTEIELQNAIEQGKPVAIVSKYPDKNIPKGKDYVEKSLSKINGDKVSYRLYRDGYKAISWLMKGSGGQ